MRTLFLGFGLLLLCLSGARSAAAEEFQFERLNRVYDEFLTDLAPIEVGPAHVDLRSPKHSLTLVRHKATLSPAQAGAHKIAIEVRVAGRGLIEADVSLGAISTTIEDDLVVPAQTLRLEGTAAVAKSAEGYVITTLSMPAETQVRIESQLATRLFKICHQMVLVLVNLDCVDLQNALTRVRVPLPPAGESYLLGFEELTPAEQAALDGYLR